MVYKKYLRTGSVYGLNLFLQYLKETNLNAFFNVILVNHS